MAYLRLTNIAKRYGDFTAIEDLSLAVEQGAFVCFLGPSGCGKTTLLRIIAGLERQSSGRVEIGGRDLSLAPPSARDYGIVFQSYALFPNLSVADNVAYGLKNQDKSRRAARVAELLALVGLPDIGGKFPGQLSGGQQQRVALARALAPSPHLLLLDEPLSALDAQVRQGLRQQIRQLHVRLGLTTIMVTHDQEEALTMADRIVVMDHGRIEQVGSPQEIYARPASLFVARFVGAMNFLPGQAEGGGTIRLDDLVLRCADDSPPGSAVTLCLRPEDVVLRDPAGPNLLTGRIEALELLGPFHRATLRIDRLKEPLLADISANLMRDLQLAPGRPVTLALPPDRLQKFAIDRR